MNQKDAERYFFATTLGASIILSVGAASVNQTLSPGRYLVYPMDLVGGATRCWVRQGDSSVLAVAGAPATPLGGGALAGIEFSVQAADGVADDAESHIAVIGDSGVTGELVVVKISRGRA